MEEHNEGVSMARSLQEIRQHLAGEWLFENNFKDTSGNENDGTPINIEWTSTNRGLKPILNGSTAYIELDESYTFSSNHSLSFWMKMYPQDFLGIVSGVTGAYDYLRFGNSAGNFGNNIYGETSTDSDSLLLDFTGEFDTISMNTWYFFTVTQGDSNDWTLYINGVPNGTASTTDTNMIIKRLGQGRLGGDHFNGNFDKFYIHSTLLTEAETLALYNATSGEYGPSWAEKSYQHDPLAAIP
ncbi:MAG: LamG domain-containing protein, partial [Gammaproteobacteria bacterium]|nr:LamG domain-containing protein [Gammaproteobacteria bacterium]